MKLINVTKQFATETACLDYLEKMRWPSGVCCIECGSVKVETLKLNVRPTGKASARSQRRATKRAATRRVYQCLERECLAQFTATTGTVFHKTHLPLNTWFMAIALICEAKKGISANQLKRHLRVNYRTAWFLCHRIREAMADGSLLGRGGKVVEVDETYLAPRKPRKGFPKRKKQKNDVVLGMLERGGKLRLVPIADAKLTIIEPVMLKNISRKALLQTDKHPTYDTISRRQFEGGHRTINHIMTYGEGENHTNSIENAFSLLKRGVYGTFHKLSTKHLARYCNEFSYRFNRRKAQESMFAETVRELLNRIQMPYKKLVTNEAQA